MVGDLEIIVPYRPRRQNRDPRFVRFRLRAALRGNERQDPLGSFKAKGAIDISRSRLLTRRPKTSRPRA